MATRFCLPPRATSLRKFGCTRDIIRCRGPADREAFTKGCHRGFTFREIGSRLTGGETVRHGVDARAARAVLQPSKLFVERYRQ